MNENPNSSPIPLGADDKVASVMMYFTSAIFWGDIAIRKQFKPSTWLTTNGVPDNIHLLNSKAIFASNSPNPKPAVLNELIVPSATILAYHQVPPNFDPVDYDPNEPNMQMCPVDAFFGTYLFSGKLRISTKHTLLTYLEITHVTYLCFYDVVIQNTFMPNLGSVKVPFALVRKEGAFLNLAK
jgi:hypothetical protein